MEGPLVGAFGMAIANRIHFLSGYMPLSPEYGGSRRDEPRGHQRQPD